MVGASWTFPSAFEKNTEMASGHHPVGVVVLLSHSRFLRCAAPNSAQARRPFRSGQPAMDKKKKAKEKTLPVALVMEKPPLASGKKKVGLPKPRHRDYTTGTASASAAPAKPHPPPPPRLPASHFKRANHAIELLNASTSATVVSYLSIGANLI